MRSPIGTKILPLNRDAFTLIELTLVAALLLVMVGLSMPIFKKTFSDLSARDTSYSISRLINYAQEMAVLKRKNFKIEFDFERGAYRFLEISDAEDKPSYKNVSGRFGRSFLIPRGLKLSGTRKDMIFYSDGHCDDQKINVLTGNGGYSVTTKRFGNISEIEEIESE